MKKLSLKLKKAKVKARKKRAPIQYEGSSIPGHGSVFRRFFPNL
jgi:hypothetical protein